MKKILSVLLAVMMLMSAMPVMATEVEGAAPEIPAVVEAPETPAPEAPVEEEEEEHVCSEATCGKKVVDGICWSYEAHISEEAEYATCEEDGKLVYPCLSPDCDREHNIEITDPAKGHTPKMNGDEYATDTWYDPKPDCATGTNGVLHFAECERSTEKDPHGGSIEVVAAHDWQKVLDKDGKPVVVAPTCTEAGYTEYYCTQCQATDKKDDVDALKHDYYNKDDEDKLAALKEANKLNYVTYTYGEDDVIIFMEMDTPHCDLPGKIVEFSVCERCQYKDIVLTTSTDWTVESHQEVLDELTTPDEDETVYDVMDDIAAEIGESFEGWNKKITYTIDATTAEIIPDSEHATVPEWAVGAHHAVKVTVVPADCDDTGLITLECTGCDPEEVEGVVACGAKAQVVIPAYGHSFDLMTDEKEVWVNGGVERHVDIWTDEEGNEHYDEWYDVWLDTTDCTKNVTVLFDCTVEGCDFEAQQIELQGAKAHKHVEYCGYPDCGWHEDDHFCGVCDKPVDGDHEDCEDAAYYHAERYYYQKNAFETVGWTKDFSEIAECNDYQVKDYCQGHHDSVEIEMTKQPNIWLNYHINDNITVDDVDYAEKNADKYTVKGNGEHVLGGDYNNEAYKAPTCYEKGYVIYNCDACGFEQREIRDMLEHDKKSEITVKPTCTTEGEIKWTCKTKGCTWSDIQVVPATGHEWILSTDAKKTYAPDCNKETDGNNHYYCLYCDETIDETVEYEHTVDVEFVKAQAKIPGSKYAYKAPTCTEPGSMSFQCDVCHRWFFNEPIKATGHSYEKKGFTSNYFNEDNEQWYDTYTKATCTDAAVYTRTCTNPGCKHVDKVNGIAALGHVIASYDYDVDTAEEGKINVATLVISKLPTCTEKGLVHFNCARPGCGELVENFELPVLPHNEVITWNEAEHRYEITCQPIEIYDEDFSTFMAFYAKTLVKEQYIYSEIYKNLDSTHDKEEAEAVALYTTAYVAGELAKRMVKVEDEGNYITVEGIGCGKVIDKIQMNKTHYEIEYTENADGTATVELIPDENCALLNNPMVIVNWAYTLSDGTAFSYTRLIKVDWETGTYDLGLAEAPAGSELESVTVIVTDTATLDITVAAKGFGYDQWPKA